MPEGPECKIIAEKLNKSLKNKILHNIVFYPNSRYVKHNFPEKYQNFKEKLPLKISSVNVKGKLLWFDFGNDIKMLNTLGMSGIWTYNKEKHCDIEFVYTDEEKNQNSIFFKDVRHFGTIKFLLDKPSFDKKIKSIGPDVLSKDFITFEQFNNLLDKYGEYDLPKILMNQSKISGIGNYLKAEILYCSQINPFTLIKDLSSDRRRILYENILEIPKMSFLSQGVSIRDYITPDNNKGIYQYSLKVYARKKDDFGNSITRDTTSDNRTTYWCPEIQFY